MEKSQGSKVVDGHSSVRQFAPMEVTNYLLLLRICTDHLEARLEEVPSFDWFLVNVGDVNAAIIGLHRAVRFHRPVLVTFDSAKLDGVAQHNNGLNPFLKNERPEVVDGLWHWPLRADEASLA